MKSNEFVPEKTLRKLGFHKLFAKKRPPQTIYWHLLNTYYCAKTLSELLPKPLTPQQRRCLAWAALLHDIGKKEKEWQERQYGAHMISPKMEDEIRNILKDSELTQGHGPQSDEEINLIIELIREHHTRKSMSNPKDELLLSILKLADTLVSAQRMESTLIDMVRRFVQGNYKPIVLTAEQHPISPYALSVADQYVEDVLGERLFLVNAYQSMYLVKEDTDLEGFKQKVKNAVTHQILAKKGEGKLLKKIYSWVSEGPIRDKDAFFLAVHANPDRIKAEIEKELESREKTLERERKKGNEVDERLVWFGPFRVLHHATQLYYDNPNDKTLLGTDIPFPPPGVRKDSEGKAHAKKLADKVGCGTPIDFAHKIVDLIKDSTSPLSSVGLNLDIFTWSDETVDASSMAQEAYQYYRRTQWNSRSRSRNVDKYCFSCKRRKPTQKAPSDPMKPTDTWTSAAVKKGKVHVCELCFITHAYILPEEEPGKFNIIATPAYNQARINWQRVFWEDLASPDFVPHQISAHHVVLPIKKAKTPNEALSQALGYDYEFKYGSKKDYLSYIDMLYLHGLHGTIGMGPQHPGPYTLSGNGIKITSEQWEIYRKIMSILSKTSPQKKFPVINTWNRLTGNTWGWGTLLAIRQRRGLFKRYHIKDIEEWIKMRKNEEKRDILRLVENIPLYVGDRDERFKSAESILRRMEDVTRRAAKDPEAYGGNEEEIIGRIAERGKKQLRIRIQKNSNDNTWKISNEKLKIVDEALNALARELWRLRDKHNPRQDFINAVIMAMAYSPKEEKQKNKKEKIVKEGE